MAGMNPNQAPKILLAKPGLVTSAKFNRTGAGAGPEDDPAAIRSRLPSVGSLNLLSDTWDFQTDRFLPFLTDNTDFTVVGVIGPPGVGKSTILNEIYGSDSNSPAGMLPPFGVESEETRATAKHLTSGIEPRITSERIILLDTQPVFSPSVLAETIRPDGSSTVSVISGESLSADLAHEMMSIQLGVFLASICHIIIVVSAGAQDSSMWRLMSTVDLLKHAIPDPSSLSISNPQMSSVTSSNKDSISRLLESKDEYLATPIFVHTRLRDRDITTHNFLQMKKALAQCLSSSTFVRSSQDVAEHALSSAKDSDDHGDLDTNLKLFIIPSKAKDDSTKPQTESYSVALSKLRNQVLSMSGPSFSRSVSERDWLKNSGKIWEIIKNSPTIADYCRMLQNSGLFRKL